LAGTDKDITESLLSKHGFAGLSRRQSTKPIIAAANGDAYGGGFEILLNSDLVVANGKARFGLTEAHVGVTVGAGGLERLVRTAGRQASNSNPDGCLTSLLIPNFIFVACRRITANS
jgi:enoyl-CoA hydratase/carnithine racemase